MSIKKIFLFFIFLKIILLNPAIYQLEKYGEMTGKGENYYYLDIQGYEIGEQICIEILYEDAYDLANVIDIPIGRMISDDHDKLSFEFMPTEFSKAHIIIGTSSTFYYIIPVWIKKKYLLISTSGFTSGIETYSIRHINFTIYEFPQYQEIKINGEKYLFLNLNGIKQGDKIHLQISFEYNLFKHNELPLGIYQSDNNTFFFINNSKFITSHDFHTSDSIYTFNFKIILNTTSKYLMICTPNLRILKNKDFTIKHIKNNFLIIFIIILIISLIFIGIIIALIIYFKRRKKSDQNIEDAKFDTPKNPRTESIDCATPAPVAVDYQKPQNNYQALY